MPAIMGMCGFEARNSDRDRLTNVASTPTYDTSNLPTTSSSATSAGGSTWTFRAPWYDDVNATQYEPSTNEYWMHARVYTNINNTSNDTLIVGTARNSGEHIAVSAEDSTNKVTIRIAGTVRATAASAAFSLAVWARVHLHVGGVIAGSVVSVYLDGNLSTPVVTYTLIGADATALAAVGKPNEFKCSTKSGDGAGRFDDLVAMDPADADFPGIEFLGECSIKPQIFTGDGAESDWSGSFADIDELPASDVDKITAAAVGDESSFTKAAIAEDNVYAVKVMARVTRTGTDAGSNLILRINDGSGTDDAQVAAPADGDVWHIFQLDADGNAWSAAAYDATRIAFEAAT